MADDRSFSNEAFAAQAKRLAKPLCEAEGMELVHVEFQRESKGRVLRAYIDKPGGTTLNDCINISRQLSDILDIYFEERGSYHLEISSPGSDRPLGTADDYDRFKGEEARIKTKRLINGQKNFNGILQGISGGMVQLQVGEKTVAIPFKEIARTRLVNYSGENKCL